MNHTPSLFSVAAVAGILLAAASTLSCSSSTTTPTPPAKAAVDSGAPPDEAGAAAPAATITTANLMFMPNNVTIKPGQTVRWTLAPIHNVVSGKTCMPDMGFTSGAVGAVSTFDHTFPTAGSFPFYCDPHCSSGMTGTITVAP